MYYMSRSRGLNDDWRAERPGTEGLKVESDTCSNQYEIPFDVGVRTSTNPDEGYIDCLQRRILLLHSTNTYYTLGYI
jgi:hypothetical protein